MKTIEEQIAVMQHFANGGEVEYYNRNEDIWQLKDMGNFNWKSVDYRIKEQKQTVNIERWLLSCNETDKHYNLIVETSNIENYIFDWSNAYKKVKLLDSYEVEI